MQLNAMQCNKIRLIRTTVVEHHEPHYRSWSKSNYMARRNVINEFPRRAPHAPGDKLCHIVGYPFSEI